MPLDKSDERRNLIVLGSFGKQSNLFRFEYFLSGAQLGGKQNFVNEDSIK